MVDPEECIAQRRETKLQTKVLHEDAGKRERPSPNSFYLEAPGNSLPPPELTSLRAERVCVSKGG